MLLRHKQEFNMDPLTLLIIAGAGKAGAGLWQRHQANKLAKKSSLDGAQIPNEYRQNLAQAQRQAREGMPEQAYVNQANQLNQNLGFGARQLSTRRNTAGGLQNLVANTNRGFGQLNAADAQARVQNQGRLLTAREIIARAKQNRYDQEQQAIGAMRGAGMQNIAGGFDTAATGALVGLEGGGSEKGMSRRAKRKMSGKMAFTPNASPTDYVDISMLG
jgi:hypothetical protein